MLSEGRHRPFSDLKGKGEFILSGQALLTYLPGSSNVLVSYGKLQAHLMPHYYGNVLGPLDWPKIGIERIGSKWRCLMQVSLNKMSVGGRSGQEVQVYEGLVAERHVG